MGCDTTAVRRLADRLRETSDQFTRDVFQVLDSASKCDGWEGPDADSFRKRALGATSAATEVAELLNISAQTLVEEADQQDGASRAPDNTHPPSHGTKLTDLKSTPQILTIDHQGFAEVGGADSPQRRDSRVSDGDPSTITADESKAEEYWNKNHPEGPAWNEWINRYHVGPPERPKFHWDDDFPFESKMGDETFDDRIQWMKWESMMRGAQLTRPDLDDSVALYEHYRDASGTAATIDYEEGYKEDPAIRSNVDTSVQEAQFAARRLIENGNSNFSFTGPDSPIPDGGYPETENWQKTLGGYRQWSHGDVTVDESGHVRMVVTVNAEDHYNFNASQKDIASGAPDDANGRFSELGWAQGFDVSGTVTRVVEWDVENPSQMKVSEP
jgi:hypothetical protein